MIPNFEAILRAVPRSCSCGYKEGKSPYRSCIHGIHSSDTDFPAMARAVAEAWNLEVDLRSARWAASVAREKERANAAEARVKELEGTIRADDERLRRAGERTGIFAGCDTAEWLADEVLNLRIRIAVLEKIQKEA